MFLRATAMMGTTNRFDVNDAALREEFLRRDVAPALVGLGQDATALWGHMTPQQMVEHLIWAFELSTGRAEAECTLPAAEVKRMGGFLYHNRPAPRGFMNPALVAGLPALRYATLAEAKAALGREVTRFLDETLRTDQLHIHPIFGPIGYEEWHRTHYKHTHHHLSQFGLIEEASN